MTRTGVSVSRRGICALLAPAAALLGIVSALGGCSAPGESGVTEDQLISDLSAAAELTDVPVADALYEYVDPSAWEAGEATFEQSGSDDGTVSVRATVPVSNDSYAAEERLSATYVKGDDGTWTGSWRVESVDGLRAVSGVQHDERRWDSGSAPSEEGRHRVIASLSGTTDTEGLPAAMSILADSDPVGLSGGDTEIEYNLIVEAQTKNRNRGTVAVSGE